jgi:stage II sporulation protein D
LEVEGVDKAGMLPMSPTYHRPRTRLLIATTVASLALCAAPAGASTLVISGAGDGHGVGMSQDGALGYAEHGYTYQAILAHYYTGTALGQAPPNTNVRVLVGTKVKKVPLERYVRGVVAAEMPSGWPLAALEAQAVASRTYALTAHAGGSRFDVYSDTRSQVYRGVAAETAQTNTAIAATAGQIVTYAGKPAITYFFASSGGMTESIQNSFLGSAPEPWLVGVADLYDGGAPSAWKLSLSFAAAGDRLKGLVEGAFRGIEVLKRGVSPRIISAQVLGSGGSTAVSGPELAARLGLDDTWAYFSVKNGKTTHREPDESSNPTPTTASPPTPAGPQGGAQGPGSPPSTTRQGGAQASASSSAAIAGGTAAD